MQSAVMIVPDAHKAAADAFGESMGWGPGNYSVPLSPTGALPATHWGCRANVSEGFLELLADPPAEAAPILAVVTMDIRSTDDARGHFLEVAAGIGLRMVEGE